MRNMESYSNRMEYEKAASIRDQIKSLKQINEEQKMIFKKFNFKNFQQSLNFVNQVGILAEKEGHHPDISLGWGYCLIMVHTHAIKGLSINDFILASKIDLIDNN